MKSTKISIVVPYYNTPVNLFNACIYSILNQDYDNKEIIIIDDGSKDEFAREADVIAEQAGSIRVIHQENGGEGAARNRGILESKGDFIVFVDSDDGLAQGWLTYSMKLAQRYDADIVTGKVVRVSEITKNQPKEESIDNAYISKDSIWKVQRDSFYFKTNLINNLDIFDPGVCSKLIRKKCIESLTFPIGIKLSSDQVFNQQMISKCDGIVLTNRIAYYYVMNDMSISHVYQPNAVDYMMKSMSLIEPVVFNNDECKQAFCYRVLAEITEAIQYAYFSDKHKISFYRKIKGIGYAAGQFLVQKAMKDIDINQLPSKQWKLKAYLIRYKMAFSFVVLKIISDAVDKS